MFTLKRPSHAFPGTYESREVANEPQRLEHQRWRLAEILDREMVSREMADYLRRRLSEIDRRLSQLDISPPPRGRWLAPARDEEGQVHDGRRSAMTDTRTIPAISPAEVAQRRSGGKAVDLIDVRTPVEFEEVHAKGATFVPLDRLDPAALLAARTGPPDEPIYVICRSGARAAKACEAFRAAGFPNVFNVEGGTDAWQRAGLPVVRGARTVISLERQVRIAAGLLVVAGVLLGWLAHPVFYALSAFVGAGLVFAGVTDTCGMGMLLARMPWNRQVAPCATTPAIAGGGAKT